jgi:hypothetical protein
MALLLVLLVLLKVLLLLPSWGRVVPQRLDCWWRHEACCCRCCS